jgi:hypothetical protein
MNTRARLFFCEWRTRSLVPNRGNAKMRRAILCAVLLGALLCFVSAKGQENQAQGFRWNWRESQELSATQNLRNIKILTPDKQAIAAAIIAQLRSMSEVGIESPRQLQKAAFDTRVKLIPLDQNRAPEVVAQALVGCGATGNCPFWVFRKIHRKYKLMLRAVGQTFTIQNTVTDGYRNIVVAMQGSALDSELKEYRYEDGFYRGVGCYSASWHVREGDTVRTLKAPIVTPFPCDHR